MDELQNNYFVEKETEDQERLSNWIKSWLAEKGA